MRDRSTLRQAQDRPEQGRGTTNSRSARAESSGDWIDYLRPRLADLRLEAAREAEIIEELSQHLDARYDELRGSGASEADARRLAIEELLNPDTLGIYMRALRQANVPLPIALGAPRRTLFSDLRQDLRYAVRTLRKQPGFAAAAVLTLALGIGVNGAMFALVDATLLKPLPLRDPDRLVKLWERTETDPHDGVSPLNLIDWSSRTRSFEAIGGFVSGVGGMVMSGKDGIAETVPRQWVTAGIFDALGVRPIAGRTFLPSDDHQRASVVVLSEGFWRARFDASPAIVGSSVRLDGSPYTVVGVVPDEAQLIGRTSIWAMAAIQGAPPQARTSHFLEVIGRMKPGVTRDAATADLAAVADALAREHPKTNKGRSVTVVPLDEAVVGAELRQTSLLFLGVVGFVLLICCANVANLLLTRATVRARELAIRSALGADRFRVIRQLLTESLVLSMLGGSIGVAVGAVILSGAHSIVPKELLPNAISLTFDVRVMAFCAAAALISGIVFGVAPAWHAMDLSSAQTIAAGATRTTTGGGAPLRRLLVVAQVAAAVMLLVGAGLLLRTLLTVEWADRGYRAKSVLTMLVDPIDSRYPNDAAMLRFYEAVEHEVRALPGVRSVAWTSTLPYGDTYTGEVSFDVVGAPPAVESQRPMAHYQLVSPDYFAALELDVLQGRAFNEHDTGENVGVCIVNEAFVQRYLRGRSPIGARIALRDASSAQSPPVVREVVGVARQVKRRPDELEDLEQIYAPLAQDPIGDMYLAVRPAVGSADTLAPSVRAAIGRIDKEQLVSVRGVMTLGDVAWDATAHYRFRAVLVMAFAGLALLLAMVGLFGILAYAVQQRVRDFGVRRALGATTGDVLRLVAGNAIRTTAMGMVIGLILSTLLGRLLGTMLFGVKPLDFWTFTLVTMVVALTAAVSAFGPAWRAARIDPVAALRSE
jgi:putative ABC transport system permease protein